jgi:hypothetical protein
MVESEKLALGDKSVYPEPATTDYEHLMGCLHLFVQVSIYL